MSGSKKLWKKTSRLKNIEVTIRARSLNGPFFVYKLHFKFTHTPQAFSLRLKIQSGETMKKVALIARILLGLMFTVFGLNGLMMAFTGNGFMPMPPPPPTMVPIMTGFMAMKYMMPLVSICQFTSGVLLLSGFFVNAGLVLLGPIVVNILAIHLAVEPTGLPMAIAVVVLYLIVLFSRWNDFRPLLKMK